MLQSNIISFFFILPSLVLAASIGALTISHPLSQQFPPVARVDQPYQWTFSDSTFSPSSSLTYTAFNLPPWLSFQGSSRTFMGNPTSDDIGNRLVQITATSLDGQSTISDHVALSVSDHTGNLTLGHSIAEQLSLPNSASITSAYPYDPTSTHYPGVRVPPNWSFSLGFTPSTFIAPTRVFYSAALSNGLPLPSWLLFNNQTVTFDGVTPQDSNGQIYEIILFGSDVFGYSDIQQSFTVVISAHELQLSKPMVVNMTLGYSSEVGLKSLLKSSLIVDGQKDINISDLSNVEVDTSSLGWLSYSPTNISLTGAAPPNQQNQDLPITITDKNGDTLNTTLKMAFYPSLFSSDKPDPVIIEAGKVNTILLGKYFRDSSMNNLNLTASFDPKEAGSWLSLSNDQKSLTGTSSDNADYDSVTCTLRAQDLNTNAFSKSILTLSMFSNTTTATHPHPHAHSHGLSSGTKIAISVVCSLVGILLLIFLLLQCRRRRASLAASRGTEHGGGYDSNSPTMEEGKWSYEAAETPALEYVEKMGGDPATTQMLVLGRIDGGSSETVVGPGGGVPTGVMPHHRMGSSNSASTNGNRAKKSFLSNPFGKGNKRVIPKISNPIIMPSLSNAAFQAQLVAAVDKAGIVDRSRQNSTYSDTNQYDSEIGDLSGNFTATPSYITGSEIDRSQNSSKLSQRSDMTGGSSIDKSFMTEDSKFATSNSITGGQSSRASWESEPPFIWTTGDTPGNMNQDGNSTFRSSSRSSSATNETNLSIIIDPNAPTQRSDFKVTNIPIPIPTSLSSSSSTSARRMMARAESPIGSINSENEGISIDNIHFPTDSDLAHTETSSLSGDDPTNGVIIQIASRIDARRTLDSPATASLASSHTERAASAAGSVNGIPSPVMTTHSRLVSFGKQKKVEVEQNGKGSISHSAVIEAGSIGLGIGVGMGMSTPQHIVKRGYTPSPPPESPLPQPPNKAITRPRVSGIAIGNANGSSSRSPTPPSSLPSLPALPTLPSTTSNSSKSSKKTKVRTTSPLATPQRILLGVSEPFHFYPPLTITPSNSSSTNKSSSSSKISKSDDVEYLAFVEKRLPSLKKGGSIITKLIELPDWLHFEDGELWGVPRQQDRGEIDVRIVERKLNVDEERVVGRFSLEVVGR